MRTYTTLLVLMLICVPSTGQEKPKAPLSGSSPYGTSQQAQVVRFDIHDPEEVLRFARLRKSVEWEAIGALQQRALGKPVENHVACAAADLLGKIGVDSEASIAALCDNVSLNSGKHSELRPLAGFVAADVLIAIGTKNAVQGVFKSMSVRRSRKEMLIFAHVLRGIDDPAITWLRCEAARDAAPADAEHADYREAVEKLGLAVNNPSLVKDLANWPSRVHHAGRLKPGIFFEFPEDAPARTVEPGSTPRGDSNNQAETRNREAAEILGDGWKTRDFLSLCKKVEREAIGMLWRRANGEAVQERAVCDAARLLGVIRSEDSTAIKVLSENLDLYEPGAAEPTQPLDGFVAAQALVQIGGVRAFAGMFGATKGPLDRKQLLIRAHILKQIDEPKIVDWRLERAISEAPTAIDQAKYPANLAEIRKLLSSADFAKDRNNWPSMIDK